MVPAHKSSLPVIAALMYANLCCAQTFLLVLNKEGSVAIVDPVTEKVVGRAVTGEGPHEIASVGKLAVVSNYGSGRTLSVIDVPSRKEVRRVDVSPLSRPHGLFAFDGKVYFTAEGSRTVARYDPASNRVDWSMRTEQDGTHMVAVGAGGRRIYTTNMGADTVSILEVSAGGGGTGSAIHVGSAPEGFDVSPDGTRLWVANGGDPTVSIIDINRKQVIGTINAGTRRSNRLKFTPAGDRVLISDLSTGELIVVDVRTRKVAKRIKVSTSTAGILVAPDGSKAYVAATSDNFVGVVDLAKLELVSRIRTGNGPDGMDWITLP